MTPPVSPSRQALAWRVAHASVAFLLDVEEIGRQDRDHDLVDSLIFAAILSANMAPVTRDAGLQLAYASIDAAAPDELRRPVSINAIAISLRMPFETVRRRVRALQRDGVVEAGPQGIVAPNTTVGGPAFLASILARHERLGALYRALRDTGALPDDASPAAAPTDPPPVRITNRAIWEYVLRATDDLMGLTGDVVSALILLAIVRGNTEGMSPDGLAAWARDPVGCGQPVRTAGLAARLNLSRETTRRYVIALEAAGFCRRTSSGLFAGPLAGVQQRVERLAVDNLTNLQRMFARLRKLGALAPWDADQAGGSSASR